MINYNESVSGDISSNPASPLEFTLAGGTNTISATTGDGDQEYLALTIPEGFQLDSLVLESFTPNDVAFIGVQQGDTFTEPLDDSAIRGNILGYTLFGNPRQIGTDILDEIGNGLNAIGFEGALPSGTYTFAIQQLGEDSDYTLAFNVSEVTEDPILEETPTGELPIVSFEVLPINFSEEAESNLVEWRWTVEGDFPEEGITVNLTTAGGDFPFAFLDQFAAAPGAEFIDADIVGFDGETGDLNILLMEPEASFQLFFANDILEEGTQTFNFNLVEGEGYIVDPEQNANEFTISDDNGGPGVGPTVGISVSETNLVEGDPITVSFTLDGDIPESGVQILVQGSVPGILGQFDISDLSTLELTGIEGLPEVGDAGGGSFLVTITEPTASITTSIFNDILAEEPLEVDFTLANGEVYEVDPDASSITLAIADEEQPVGPTVSFTADNTDVFEGDIVTLTFDVEGEIPAEGVTVLVNDIESAQNDLRSLTEFDVGNLELTGISGFPTPAEGDSGFFITISEPTATIVLPIFDEGADEDEATEVFTFDLIDGEAYEVNPDANSVTFNITDVGDTPVSAIPVVSFEVTPINFSEEAESNLVEWRWTVEGDFPEEGITVNLTTAGGDFPFAFLDQFAAAPGAEFIDADIVGFDGETGDLNILLMEPEASFQLFFANDILEEGTQTFNFNLVEGEGYIVDPEQNANEFTISDDNGGPGVGPTVGISVSETNLVEGDPITVSFTLDGDIPESGVQILVQGSVPGILGQFDISDLSTLELTGIEGLPEVGDAGGGSFLVTITEPTASITTSIFNDILAEEPLEVDFTLANGEVYEVDPDASSITLAIADEEQPVGPTVSFTADNTDVFEGDIVTLTFDVEGEIPAEGVTVLVNDIESAQNDLRSLTEFDVGNLELTGISGFPTPAEGDSGFFITISEPTATIVLPIFDEGADEDEATEVFTFDLIDGEAYEVNPDANSVTFNITDVGDTPLSELPPAVSLSIEPDVLSEEDDLPTVVVNFSVDGEIPADGLSVLVTGSVDILDQVDGARELEFNNAVLGEFFNAETATFEVIVSDNEGSIVLPILNDIIQEEDTDFGFTLLENDGSIDSEYVVVADASSDSVTLIDGNGGAGVGPTVGISVSSTELTEGDEFTVNFNIEGDIPDGGLTVLVDSDTFAALGEFNIFDADGNPAFATTGIEGIPVVGDTGASSFLVNITEADASITLSVFDDGPDEGLEEFTFSLVDGEIYEVNADAASIGFSIDDGGIIGDANLLDTAFTRFQNSAVPGTYVYATGAEADGIRANYPDFIEEGVAFTAAIAPNDELIAINRLQSNEVPGAFLYVDSEELATIDLNSFTDQGVAFYAYGAGVGAETTFTEFNNSDVPGTLFATGAEADAISANLPNFVDQGIAFEALI